MKKRALTLNKIPIIAFPEKEATNIKSGITPGIYFWLSKKIENCGSYSNMTKEDKIVTYPLASKF